MTNIYLKKILFMKSIMICFIILSFDGNIKMAFSANDQISWNTPLAPNTVSISPDHIIMPLDRIFLIRKGQIYGAVKFTKFVIIKEGYNEYALYESWYQDNGSGIFISKNVEHKERKASSKLFGIGRFSFNIGNEEVQCGKISLWWIGSGLVYFYKRGNESVDSFVELAPTKWNDIKEVNVFDPRITWYKYEKNRPDVDIPIDKLW